MVRISRGATIAEPRPLEGERIDDPPSAGQTMAYPGRPTRRATEPADSAPISRCHPVTSRYVLVVSDGRAEAFTKIFGSNRVPVEGPVAEFAVLPRGASQHVYKIDMAVLTEDERKALEEYLSQVWDMPLERVTEEVANRGVPIRAEGTTFVDRDPEPDFA